MWIRRPTGQLCVDLMRPQKPIHISSNSRISISDPEATALFAGNEPDIEVLVIDTLTLEAYHTICHGLLGTTSSIDIRAGVTVHLGAVISRPTNDLFSEIASLPDAGLEVWGWQNPARVHSEPMENGWTRFNARDVDDSWLVCSHGRTRATVSWLSQANHMFRRCQITSNLEDYVLVDFADFFVTVSTTEDVPVGFLFLCPTDDFRISTSSVGWPACPAYWSLDPSGTHSLSTEEANKAGFPELQVKTSILGQSWDSSVYAGLCKFHRANGFDPYGQDVARHLGHKLWQPSGYVDPPFAHVVEEEDDSQEQDDPDSEMDVDPDNAADSDDGGWSDMDID
ncbi:hypothetical protein DFH06DRAFT_618287 [Mycena polygramma]|nr:hypothetical protein DFH06DRAFT_618287 [Mycena polygramma]